MAFLFPLALLGLGLLGLPLFAHALRRGRVRSLPFPAARLVQARAAAARERRKLEDRLLLALRLLLVASVVVLGASPLLSCARLTLTRTGGASLAAALVLDDSGSMRARLSSGEPRFERARAAALELVAGARSGDAFAVVLAGRPARVALPATTDLASVRRVLEELRPSDRPTDLGSALALATSTLEGLPQSDRRSIVLSDFATDEPVVLPPSASAPLAALQVPLANCAVVRAARVDEAVEVELRCTDPAAERDRTVRLLDAEAKELARAPAADTVVLRLPGGGSARAELTVELTRPEDAVRDALPEDDRAAVLTTRAELAVGLYADATRAGRVTGGSTLPRAALEALALGARVEPLDGVPDTAAALAPLAALVLDDPPGLGAEARAALEAWLSDGGVALALLGPAVERAQLGASFSPFVEGAPSFTPTKSPGAARESEELGGLAGTWSGLEPKSRVIAPEQPAARALVRFDDGAPLVLTRPAGRGLVLTALLPSSVEHSDFSLRPAYLGLLEHVLEQAALRRGAAATVAGVRWELAEGTTVEGPSGPVPPLVAKEGTSVEPAVAGRYLLRRGGAVTERFVVVDPDEVTRQPRPPGGGSGRLAGGGAQKVDVSREIALLALGFGVLELALRLLGRARRRAIA